jgi:WG containing repeat
MVLGLIMPSGIFIKIGNYSDYKYYQKENIWALRNNDRKYAFFNSSFQKLSDFDFESVGRKMHNGLVDVEKNGKVGVVTKTGVEIIPFQYNKESYSITDNCEVQPNNTIAVRQDNKYWCVNLKGEKILPGPYDYLEYQNNNIYRVKQNGKYGLVDVSGKIIVPAEYNELYFYLPNLVTVKKDTKWGLINTEGKILLPSAYDAIYSDGYLIAEGKKVQLFDVVKAGNYGVVDNQGKTVLPLDYTKVYIKNGVTIAQKGMSLTELATAEVTQYKKMLAGLGELATNFEKARNLYNNRANCPGGCLNNYKNKTDEFLKGAKALRDYFNNSKTLGTNPEYSTAKTQLAKIVADAETNNTDVQNLNDVASNNGGGNIGDGKLQGITSNVREVQWIIEADTKARKQVGVFNSKIQQVADCLKNRNRSDCNDYISMAYQSLDILKELANDKIRFVRQMGLDLQKKEFGQEMQSAFEDQLRDVEKVKTDLNAALKQPSLLDAIIMGMTRAFGGR